MNLKKQSNKNFIPSFETLVPHWAMQKKKKKSLFEHAGKP